MTVEELIELVEAVIGDCTVREAVDGDIGRALTDTELGLLVRFVAGERPEVPDQWARKVRPPPTPEQLERIATIEDDDEDPNQRVLFSDDVKLF